MPYSSLLGTHPANKNFLFVLLGREGFLTTLEWEDDWPILNGGEPILLSHSQQADGNASRDAVPKPFVDDFSVNELNAGWYQLRTPYTKNYHVGTGKSHSHGNHGNHSAATSGLYLKPNVYGLSDRDTPAALLRKQISLNMTFSATLIATDKGLGQRQTIGVSIYLSEFQHADIGVTGCANHTGVCMYMSLYVNKTTTVSLLIPLLCDYDELVYTYEVSQRLMTSIHNC